MIVSANFIGPGPNDAAKQIINLALDQEEESGDLAANLPLAQDVVNEENKEPTKDDDSQLKYQQAKQRELEQLE